jgi:hypothetical protein
LGFIFFNMSVLYVGYSINAPLAIHMILMFLLMQSL